MADGLQALGIFLASLGGAGLLGFVAGYAFKKALKIVTVVAGFFFMGLMYLHYTKMITVHWDQVSANLETGAWQAINTTVDVVNQVNQETQQANNGLMIGASGVTFLVAFGTGFMKG